MKNAIKYSCFSALLFLTACGGGGSGSSSSGSEDTQNTNTTTARATLTTINIEVRVSTAGGGIDQEQVTLDSVSSVVLSWVPPATNAFGEPLDASDISGYEVYYSSQDALNSDGEILYVDMGTTTEVTINALSAGTYQFAIAAIESGT